VYEEANPKHPEAELDPQDYLGQTHRERMDLEEEIKNAAAEE
jgi:hypothetical protein